MLFKRDMELERLLPLPEDCSSPDPIRRAAET
jgi:hypothetical protein